MKCLSLPRGLFLSFYLIGFLHAEEQAATAVSNQIQQLAVQFDRNGDHQLDAKERQAARTYLTQHPPSGAVIPSGRTGPTAPPATALESFKAGEKISTSGIPLFPNQPLYDPGTLRTLLLEFEDPDWEKELTEFARTDISVPARLTLDGQISSGVRVHFHTQAATPTTATGYKRALDLTLDATVAGQPFNGQRQLKLLDAGTDPTLLRAALYAQVAREYLPAPRTNFVRVGINGENWGIYVSVQPLDEVFIKENFGTTGGSWWSVSSRGNLAYLGDKSEAYRACYHLQSPEDSAAWSALAEFCKILNQTPPSELEAALASRLDLNSALKFLALENVMINQDGYGSSTGGYGLYLAAGGRFHLIPQEAEASFRLVELSEYAHRSRRSESAAKPKGPESGKAAPNANDLGKASSDPVPPGYNSKDFPRASATDLGMLLSYSFINKADSDFTGKITRDEWLTFARSWFLVMDEDLVGKLTRDQFITKFHALLAPASVADGRTKQTFGRDDPARIIGQDIFKVMDGNEDGQLTSQEVIDTFGRWFAAWSNPKSAILTQPALQKGFTTLFSRSVFQADQTFIAKRDATIIGEDSPGGGLNRGDGETKAGILRFGLGGRKRDVRTLVTFSEELDPLAGMDDPTKPLLARLLLVHSLRARYLEYVRDITENWLNWSKLGPLAKRYHEFISAEVSKETHKATSYAHFVQELDQDTTAGSRDGDAAPSLKNFIDERHDYLMKDDRVTGLTDGW